MICFGCDVDIKKVQSHYIKILRAFPHDEDDVEYYCSNRCLVRVIG